MPALDQRFPGSSHVIYLGLDQADDSRVREYAAEHGFTLATKNTDMVDLCVVKGAPPQILWFRVGNCPTSVILDVLEVNDARIKAFEASSQVVLSLFRFVTVKP